jgi:hypothetical protein
VNNRPPYPNGTKLLAHEQGIAREVSDRLSEWGLPFDLVQVAYEKQDFATNAIHPTKPWEFDDPESK